MGLLYFSVLTIFSVLVCFPLSNSSPVPLKPGGKKYTATKFIVTRPKRFTTSIARSSAVASGDPSLPASGYSTAFGINTYGPPIPIDFSGTGFPLGNFPFNGYGPALGGKAQSFASSSAVTNSFGPSSSNAEAFSRASTASGAFGQPFLGQSHFPYYQGPHLFGNLGGGRFGNQNAFGTGSNFGPGFGGFNGASDILFPQPGFTFGGTDFAGNGHNKFNNVVPNLQAVPTGLAGAGGADSIVGAPNVGAQPVASLTPVGTNTLVSPDRIPTVADLPAAPGAGLASAKSDAIANTAAIPSIPLPTSAEAVSHASAVTNGNGVFGVGPFPVLPGVPVNRASAEAVSHASAVANGVASVPILPVIPVPVNRVSADAVSQASSTANEAASLPLPPVVPVDRASTESANQASSPIGDAAGAAPGSVVDSKTETTASENIESPPPASNTAQSEGAASEANDGAGAVDSQSQAVQPETGGNLSLRTHVLGTSSDSSAVNGVIVTVSDNFNGIESNSVTSENDSANSIADVSAISFREKL